MTVHLDGQLRLRIASEMEAAYPNEGGGFLLGELGEGGIVIRDIIQVDNAFAEEEQHHRYAMTPRDWMRMEDEAEERGLALVGYYHSHPDSPAVPSEYDREHALPNFLYIITAVRMGQAVDMQVWKLRGDRSVFDSGLLKS